MVQILMCTDVSLLSATARLVAGLAEFCRTRQTLTDAGLSMTKCAGRQPRNNCLFCELCVSQTHSLEFTASPRRNDRRSSRADAAEANAMGKQKVVARKAGALSSTRVAGHDASGHFRFSKVPVSTAASDLLSTGQLVNNA